MNGWKRYIQKCVNRDKTDFATKARMLGLPASAGAPALAATGGRATSATLFDADADADADDDVNADNADTDNPDLSVTLMMAELRPLHSQTVSLLLLLLLKLVLPVM